MQSDLPTALVYYGYRGVAQPIRAFLTYFQVPYLNVHLDQLQQQKDELPECLVDKAKALVGTDRKKLPVLLHEGLEIFTFYGIFDYLCVRFAREELLGKDMQQRAIVEQLNELYLISFQQKMPEMFAQIEHIADLADDRFLEGLEQVFKAMFETMEITALVVRYLNLNPSPSSFVLGNLTVIDFNFANTIFFVLGTFSALCPEITTGPWKERASNHTASEWKVQILTKFHYYYEHFTSQKWWQDNKQELDKYPILSFLLNEKQKEASRKVWSGDSKVLR